MKSEKREWANQYWDCMMNENYEEGITLKEEYFPGSVSV